MEGQAGQQGGVLAGIKDRLHLDALIGKIRSSKETLIDMALYGGIGFLAGFLIRRYSSYVITGIVLVSFIALLHQFDFVSLSINWARIQSFLGLEQHAVVGDNLVMIVWGWIKANVVITVSFIIGFLVGVRVGN